MDKKPIFKYYPSYYDEVVDYRSKYWSEYNPREDKGVCKCCGKSVVFPGTIPHNGNPRNCDDYVAVCPMCVATGAAAEKFNGEFNVVLPELAVSDSERTDEILRRTPGFSTLSWQIYSWPACCDDYCACLGHWEGDMVKKLNLSDEDLNITPEALFWLDEEDFRDQMENYMANDDLLVFQCLHCEKIYAIQDPD